MWKACGYLCLLAVTTVTASPWPNGWGSGGGGGASVPAQTYNPAASAASNNDYWWMSANPFQKPANHPGVEKTAVNSVGQSYQQASSPASQYVKPVSAPQPSGGCSGGCSNSFTAPQVQPPISQPSYGGAPAPSGGGWNGPQPAFAPANVPPPAFANPPPRPSVNFECMLTNKADCHSGAPAPQINQIAPQQNFAPQQSYAPPPNTVQLPSYSQPTKPEKLISPAPSGYSPKPVPAPQVSYQQPAPALQSGYQQPAPAPQVSYQQPAPAPQVSYQQPAPAPKPSYQQPAPAPQSGYQQPAPAPQSGYQQPAPAPAPVPNQIPQGYPKPQKPAEPAPSVSIAMSGWGAPMPPRYQPAPQPAPGYQPAPQPAPGYQPAPQPAPAPAQHQHMNAGDWKGDPGPHPPYPGCAAALLCVPDNECDAKGVVVPPTTLTDAERTYRVALTACTNPMNGIIGVCCRDPNYKDPWPDMNGGGGQQHHHHEGGQAAQQQNPYSDLVEPSPSSIQGQVALLQCQSNSLCVESDRCESTGQVLPTTRRCQEDSKNGTVYICCQVGQVESSTGGHGHSFSRPNYAQQQNPENVHITDQVASQVVENEVQPERISIESNNELNESKDFQSEQVSDSVGVPLVNSGPTDTLPSTVDSGDNITRNQQRLIYESSNSFIENSSQNPVAAPSIRVSLPNLPQSVEKSQLEAEPEDIKLVINQTRSTQRSQPVPTETVPTIVEANRPNVIDPRTIPTARQVPPNGRKTKQRIRIKLVSRIGDQPNVVNLPNGAQFNNNLRFSPVQSVVAANVAKNDEEVETSDDTVAATVNDGSQTVITRPRQRVIITDLRLPKQPDPTTETPRVSPASSTSQPSYQEYKGSSQNSTSIFQEAPLVFEIHQGPNGVITEDSHGSIVMASEQNNPKSDGVFDQRNPKSDGVFGQRNPESDRVVNQRNPTNAPEKNPTNAPEKNPTPAESPMTVDIVANERKDQFHLYPFLPIGGDRQRESIVNEFGETIYVPSQTYQLPAISPEDQLRYITPPLFGDSEPEDGAEGDGSVTFFSALTQTSTDYTDECPENMKCLSEDYCSAQNPAEGDSKDFDIRLQSKKHSSSRQKCRQPHLPTDGYCCYLRDDYESVPNGELGISMNQAKAGRANSTISCGIRRPSEGESDKETSFGEFPWQALIFLNGRPSCGGVVLSERIVATSASCINVVRLEEVTIRVGEWDLRTLDEVKGHQDLSAQEFIPYPGYKPGLASDDYALLITKSRINLDYHVSPICLPNPIDRFDGQKCFSTAWSVPSSSSALEFGSRLNKASFAVIGNTECRLWKSSSGSSLPRNTFCVDPQASCLGDHGGPLVCENPSTGSYTLAGILTSKPTCPNTQGPNVYTNIASYAEWTYNILQRQFPEAVETSADIKF